jgi:hypothetical protein
VTCVHQWDVLRDASNPSDLYGAKKGARRKQQFADALAKSQNVPISYHYVRSSALPSLPICDLGSPLTDLHKIQYLNDFPLCLSIKTKFN